MTYFQATAKINSTTTTTTAMNAREIFAEEKFVSLVGLFRNLLLVRRIICNAEVFASEFGLKPFFFCSSHVPEYLEWLICISLPIHYSRSSGTSPIHYFTLF